MNTLNSEHMFVGGYWNWLVNYLWHTHSFDSDGQLATLLYHPSRTYITMFTMPINCAEKQVCKSYTIAVQIILVQL